MALGGEVEARNVQKREYLSNEIRRLFPLSKTYDTEEWIDHNEVNSFITPTQLEQYNQLVFHGTENVIFGNRFDLKYIGSGEGGAMFGYGAYFAHVKETAAYYRQIGLMNSGFRLVTLTLSNDTNLSLNNVYEQLDAIRNNPDTNIKLPKGVTQAGFSWGYKRVISWL